MKASIIIVLLTIASLCCADDVVGAGCSASVSISPRASASWTNGDGNTNQIYDITVDNVGSCQLDNVGLNFATPENSNITQQWNLMSEALYYLVQLNPSLAVGASATAGFVLTMPSSASISAVSATVYGAACPSACVNSPTGAPSTAPTSAPTSSPSSPTSAPTSSPSSPVVPDCEGNVRAEPRANSAPWTSGDYTYQIYDIIANNTGTCPWTTIEAYFAGNITQAWNYDIPSGVLSGYGNVVNPGQVYLGAGFIFATNPTALLSAPALGRMRPVCGAPCSNGN